VRKFNFIALILGIKHTFSKKKTSYKSYFEIPNNEKKYLDVIFINLWIKNKKRLFGIHFKEILCDEKIKLVSNLKELECNSDINANKIDNQLYKFETVSEFKKFIIKNSY
jgi:uncharacterized protein YaaW (UPF0174 family)